MSLLIEMGIDEIDKVIIEDAFDGKVNVENMSYDAITELSELASDFISEKEKLCRLSIAHPETRNDYLRYFGRYVKQEARLFNRHNSDEKVMFSGLLGKYMRKIKNAGATQ
jgi:hypothetical protein